MFSKPSNDRNWVALHENTPFVAKKTDTVFSVNNIRNAKYFGTDEFDNEKIVWENASYDINNLTNVWYYQNPFAPLQSHVMFSFEFTDASGKKEYLVFSKEVRKTSGKDFVAWKTLLFNFEIFWIVGREEDLFYIRTNLWKDNTPSLLAKMNLTEDESQKLFINFTNRVNKLHGEAKWYRVFSRNCLLAPMKIFAQTLPCFEFKKYQAFFVQGLFVNYKLINKENIKDISKLSDNLVQDESYSRIIREGF